MIPDMEVNTVLLLHQSPGMEFHVIGTMIDQLCPLQVMSQSGVIRALGMILPQMFHHRHWSFTIERLQLVRYSQVQDASRFYHTMKVLEGADRVFAVFKKVIRDEKVL